MTVTRTSSDRNGRRVDLCGVPVDALRMTEVVDRLRIAIERRENVQVSVINVAKVVGMRQDKILRDSVMTGDLILVDGMPLVWLSRLTGRPIPERVAGIDLMHELFKLADARGLRVYFLGAKQDVLVKVVELAKARHPAMVVAGYRDGYFTESQEQAVAEAIRDARPDVLLVAITSPKKERFMARWGERIDVPVTHGVGGSFDVMAGLTRRAPRWMQRCGLEWFYRMMQEPSRLWKRYLVSNTKFMLIAIKEIVVSRMRPAPHVRIMSSERPT
jgi:N-acetylglucosaminyldiphosphoundecaprenol N-acetyl-beta-D-mannosaminyltransferase